MCARIRKLRNLNDFRKCLIGMMLLFFIAFERTHQFCERFRDNNVVRTAALTEKALPQSRDLPCVKMNTRLCSIAMQSEGQTYLRR